MNGNGCKKEGCENSFEQKEKTLKSGMCRKGYLANDEAKKAVDE